MRGFLRSVVRVFPTSAVEVASLVLPPVADDALDDGGVAQVRPLRGYLHVHAEPLRHGEGVGRLLARLPRAHVARRPRDHVDVPGLDEVLRDFPRRTNDDLVDPLASAHVQHPLIEAHHWQVRALRAAHSKVLVDPDEQEGPASPRVLQKLRMANVEHVEGAAHVDDSVLAGRLARRRKLCDAPRAGQQLYRSLRSQAGRTALLCRGKRTRCHAFLGRASRGSLHRLLEPLQVCIAHLVLGCQLRHEAVDLLECFQPAAGAPRAMLDGVVRAQPQARGRGRLQP
mmetsp:Transcript_40501/g.126052  ORF Transcript_40501/g.126052 Transcript_40501/m.126052 type:complete len:284 (+) Transcript_40501:191-1042(+)